LIFKDSPFVTGRRNPCFRKFEHPESGGPDGSAQVVRVTVSGAARSDASRFALPLRGKARHRIRPAYDRLGRHGRQAVDPSAFEADGGRGLQRSCHLDGCRQARVNISRSTS
jgi:hypothetical protein